MDTEPREGEQPQENAEELLREIRDGVRPGLRRYLYIGLLEGVGLVVGTLVTVALLGWVLSLFGFIPGLGELAHRMQDILNRHY